MHNNQGKKSLFGQLLSVWNLFCKNLVFIKDVSVGLREISIFIIQRPLRGGSWMKQFAFHPCVISYISGLPKEIYKLSRCSII